MYHITSIICLPFSVGMKKKMKITERQKAPIRKITVGISQGSFWDWNKYQEKKMLTSLRLKI